VLIGSNGDHGAFHCDWRISKFRQSLTFVLTDFSFDLCVCEGNLIQVRCGVWEFGVKARYCGNLVVSGAMVITICICMGPVFQINCAEKFYLQAKKVKQTLRDEAKKIVFVTIFHCMTAK